MSLRFNFLGPFQATRYDAPAHDFFALGEGIVFRRTPPPSPRLEPARRDHPTRLILKLPILLVLFSAFMVTGVAPVLPAEEHTSPPDRGCR
jgi:hypothetical protein